MSTPTKNFGKRVARARGVEKQLRVDDVLVAVGIERQDPHAVAELEVDHMDRAADAHDQVGGAERVGDAGKDDAAFEEIFGAGLVEQRIHVGENRPQGVLDVVDRDDVVVDRLAGDLREGTLVLDQKRHRRMERRAAIGIGGRLAQMRRHLLDQTDGRRAAQDARRNAAAERENE